MPRANFRVNANHDPGADSFILGLKHTKSNNGRRLKDIGLQLTFSLDAVYFERVAVKDIPESATGLSLVEKMDAELGRGAKTVKELAEILGTTEGTIRSKLNQHKDKRYIQMVSNPGAPKWGLLGNDEYFN
jgi:hypothetical protein